MPASLDTVRWDELEDAYGAASEVPRLLDNVSKTRGRKRYMAVDELCSHVLHQGTIYSASPPVVRWLIEEAKDGGSEEKLAYYDLLTGFAEAARQAFEDGRAIPCHAGGDPKDGDEIRRAILDAQAQFARALNHSSPGVRAKAGELLTAFEDSGPASVKLVRDRYFEEGEAQVRAALLNGLVRVFPRLEDGDEFLILALAREDERGNRYVLRQVQVGRAKSASSAEMVDELVATFTGDEGFFEAVHALGAERELGALLKAFGLATEQEVVRVLAERMLRIVFHDQRSGWGGISYSLLREDGSKPQVDLYKSALRSIGLLLLWKLLPFIRRRMIRNAGKSKPKGIPKIRYSGLEGEAPEIPLKFNAAQERVLTALAAKAELWQFRTNLWQLFGLPDTPDGLRQFVAARSVP